MCTRSASIIVALVVTSCTLGLGTGTSAQKKAISKSRHPLTRNTHSSITRTKVTKVTNLSLRAKQSTKSAEGWRLPIQRLPSNLSLLQITGGMLSRSDEDKLKVTKRVDAKSPRLFPEDNDTQSSRLLSARTNTEHPRLISTRKEMVPNQKNEDDLVNESHIDTRIRKQFQFGNAYKAPITPHLPSGDHNVH